MVIFHSYVSLPEGSSYPCKIDLGIWIFHFHHGPTFVTSPRPGLTQANPHVDAAHPPHRPVKNRWTSPGCHQKSGFFYGFSMGI